MIILAISSSKENTSPLMFHHSQSAIHIKSFTITTILTKSMDICRDKIYHCNAFVPKQPSNSLKQTISTNIRVFQLRPVKPFQHRKVRESSGLLAPAVGKEERSQRDGEAFGGGGCRSDQHRFIIKRDFGLFKWTAFERNILQLSRSSKTHQGTWEPCWRSRPHQVLLWFKYTERCFISFVHPFCTQYNILHN